MDWNQPQPPPSAGPQNMQAPPLQGGPVQGAGFGLSPLQSMPTPPQPPMAAAPPYPTASPLQPVPVPTPLSGPAPVSPLPVAPAGAQMPAQPVQARPGFSDDKDVSSDDAVWINRAKRAIAETKGDPHRQTQVIQHMRAQYLKQRFNRTIHVDGDEA